MYWSIMTDIVSLQILAFQKKNLKKEKSQAPFVEV